MVYPKPSCGCCEEGMGAGRFTDENKYPTLRDTFKFVVGDQKNNAEIIINNPKTW